MVEWMSISQAFFTGTRMMLNMKWQKFELCTLKLDFAKTNFFPSLLSCSQLAYCSLLIGIPPPHFHVSSKSSTLTKATFEESQLNTERISYEKRQEIKYFILFTFIFIVNDLSRVPRLQLSANNLKNIPWVRFCLHRNSIEQYGLLAESQSQKFLIFWYYIWITGNTYYWKIWAS